MRSADDEAPEIMGDWREFRAKLISQQQQGMERILHVHSSVHLSRPCNPQQNTAHLLKRYVSWTAGSAPWPARVAEDNQRLLRIQNAGLAAEGVWAHATPSAERGGLLVATPEVRSIRRRGCVGYAALKLW